MERTIEGTAGKSEVRKLALFVPVINETLAPLIQSHMSQSLAVYSLPVMLFMKPVCH